MENIEWTHTNTQVQQNPTHYVQFSLRTRVMASEKTLHEMPPCFMAMRWNNWLWRNNVQVDNHRTYVDICVDDHGTYVDFA